MVINNSTDHLLVSGRPTNSHVRASKRAAYRFVVQLHETWLLYSNNSEQLCQYMYRHRTLGDDQWCY